MGFHIYLTYCKSKFMNIFMIIDYDYFLIIYEYLWFDCWAHLGRWWYKIWMKFVLPFNFQWLFSSTIFEGHNQTSLNLNSNKGSMDCENMLSANNCETTFRMGENKKKCKVLDHDLTNQTWLRCLFFTSKLVPNFFRTLKWLLQLN